MILTELFKHSKATLMNETITLTNAPKNSFIRRYKKLGNSQRWGLDFTSIPLPYQTAMAITAQLNGLHGKYGKINIPNPFLFNGIDQLVAVNSDVTAENNQVSLSLTTATNAFLVGDLVQFGHNKVYQVMGWNSGSKILEIFPPLAQSVLASEIVKTGENVMFYCSHDDDNVEITVNNFNVAIPVSAKFVEVI